MTVRRLRVAAYRSIRALDLPLDALTVFVGPNGTGKSNLYRAMMLLAAAAEGRLAAALAEEGGMPLALWPGKRRKGSVHLDAAIDDAFPGARLDLAEDRGRFTLGLQMPGFHRPFEAPELSDGTLRYLCLVGALLGYRLPNFLALNEPETSLHPALLEPLARLIAAAARRTQVWVVTHSEPLADHLARIAGCTPRRVAMVNGETRIAGLGLLGRFDDDAAQGDEAAEEEA